MIDELTLGGWQTYRNLTLFPLIGPETPPSDYLLLDEALEKGAEVTEISAGGSVPELKFLNKTDAPVLLVEGDELRGAKQNRILNLTIFVGPGVEINIPVSCVERGRWAYTGSAGFESGTKDGGGVLYSKARSKNYVNVSLSLREMNSPVGNQGEVWNDVQSTLTANSVASASASLGDAYKAKSFDIDGYVGSFSAVPLQRGVVVCLDGKPVGLEVFDSAESFRKYMTKLIRSYALTALETWQEGKQVDVDLSEVYKFLDTVRRAPTEKYDTVGEGESLRWHFDGVAGGARVVAGKPLHVASFAV